MSFCNRTLNHLHSNAQKVIFGSARSLSVSSQALNWSRTVSKISSFKTSFLNTSLLLMKNTVLQLENIGVQKLRRLHNIGSLYCRIYERKQLLELLKSLANRCRNPNYMLGGAILSQSSGFDWKKKRLTSTEVVNYYNDIDECYEIKKKTITCNICGNRLRIEGPSSGVTYCSCPDAPASVYGLTIEGCEWKPFLERGDIIVWRKEHATLKGMYEYKMYGIFDDVTADEFLSVQLDMSEFRLNWDKSTAQCQLVEEDPQSNGIVYYWEVNWPRFFSNRDYCCYREHSVNPDTGTMIVLSKSVEHPACPSKRKTWRVQDYNSVLTIKPFTSSDKPGVEFCLTGFENPGVQLPESIITWVAIRGMPDFMMNLREACLQLRKEQQLQAVKVCSNQVKEEDMAKHSYQESYSGMKQTSLYA